MAPVKSSPALVLAVDDDPISLRRLGEILDEKDYTLLFGTSGQDALELVAEGPELILLDYSLPDMNGLEVCRQLKASSASANIPVIFITVSNDPELEARVLEAGAADFVVKPYSSAVLRARVNTHIAEQRTLKQLQQLNQELQQALLELEHLARTDKLTGAWNRRRLEETVIGEMERQKRYGQPLSLLILDIDFFKKINDTHGHAIGDQVLAGLARMLQFSIRASDALARWGGEEFVLMCPGTALQTMTMLAERLREKVARTAFPEVGNVTVSMGIAEYLPGETWEHWFSRADAALYRAKASGRNQVQKAPETPPRAAAADNLSASFVQLSWHHAYECGNALIDSEHRALFAHVNHLLDAIFSDQPDDGIARMIDELVQEVDQHFRDEEILLNQTAFPGASAHAEVHRQLLAKARTLVGRFQAGEEVIAELFHFLAHDVIARHILKTDRAFFAYL